MPRNASPGTDSPESDQLLDLLKETGGLAGREVAPTHERRGVGTDTRSYLISKMAGSV